MMKYKLSLVTFFSCLFLAIKPPAFSDTPFVKGELIGQLGNQFFIIAAAVSTALDNHAIPIFPDLINKKSENIPTNHREIFSHLITEFPLGESVSRNYNEPHFHYSPIPYTPNMCIRGYFQSEKYFINHKEYITELFKPSDEITDYLKKKYGELLDHPNTVSLHIRSYFDHDPHQHLYPFHGRAYIQKALTSFPPNVRLVVFSNDMSLCKRELSDITGDIHFIEGEAHYHDFYLMSMCKHHIISNSTFSWWAAYLNPNPDKLVIAPKPWFTISSGLDTSDLIPDEWLIVSPFE